MGIDSGVNISDTPYGGKSAFTQLEHNIVAGYLLTAGNAEETSIGVRDRWDCFIRVEGVSAESCVSYHN